MELPFGHSVGFMEDGAALHTSAAPGAHAFPVAHTWSPAIYYAFQPNPLRLPRLGPRRSPPGAPFLLPPLPPQLSNHLIL